MNLNRQRDYTQPSKWPPLAEINTHVLGKVDSIVMSVNSYIYTGREMMHRWQDIHDACRYAHTRVWTWAIEKDLSWRRHPLFVRIKKDTGYDIPNFQFGCLYTQYKMRTESTDIDLVDGCSLCPCKGIECTNRYAWLQKYEASSGKMKRSYAELIKTSWR